jgi:hypothetical protein
LSRIPPPAPAPRDQPRLYGGSSHAPRPSRRSPARTGQCLLPARRIHLPQGLRHVNHLPRRLGRAHQADRQSDRPN